MKQTAVSLILFKIQALDYACDNETAWIRFKEFMQKHDFKEMEEQQIIDAFNSGIKSRYTNIASELGLNKIKKTLPETGTAYYKETYDNGKG